MNGETPSLADPSGCFSLLQKEEALANKEFHVQGFCSENETGRT
jgi:hypothetical protein